MNFGVLIFVKVGRLRRQRWPDEDDVAHCAAFMHWLHSRSVYCTFWAAHRPDRLIVFHVASWLCRRLRRCDAVLNSLFSRSQESRMDASFEPLLARISAEALQ